MMVACDTHLPHILCSELHHHHRLISVQRDRSVRALGIGLRSFATVEGAIVRLKVGLEVAKSSRGI
ncbi:hypothetical protein BU25DRAFT_8089 [Macroventuria anomochaeta]|uniref:Uncharacterized protein n=1 Tax=Macroventuria anomochaeta TaxID=301207 RepID=A0ACB6SHU1_9PLEO|nr:uncharacterized protein BU25DRAFT_8089 [Macroventuria anomochaeta]KAF2633527.1 hypothetical protein BU25DRAFT_8089 [Macroventuria anomochaeta]